MNSRELLRQMTPDIEHEAMEDARVRMGQIERTNTDLEQRLNAVSTKIDERMHDLERAQRRAHLLETSIMLALATLRDPSVQLSERNINAQFYLEAALGKK